MRYVYRGFMYEAVEIPPSVNVDGVERPSMNSKGHPIHPTQEGIVNFWRWFGDSKVVDENGRPKVMFHGSYEDFDEFQLPWDRDDYDPDKDPSDDYPGGNLGIGFYFTSNSEYAARFGKVKEYYVRINNLLDLTDEANIESVNERFAEERDELSYGAVGEIIDDMMNEGKFDGAIGMGVGGLSYGADEWKVLDGKQAKAIMNGGAFSTSDNRVAMEVKSTTIATESILDSH